jgi:hypothetical protein
MHSTDMLYTDYFPRPGQQTPESFTFHHNGDFSGDVKLDLEAWRVEEVAAADSQGARHGNAIMRVEIPFEVIARLVADAVRSNLIAQLEQDDYREILDLER